MKSAWLVAAGLLFISCDSKDLSRDEAKVLIDQAQATVNMRSQMSHQVESTPDRCNWSSPYAGDYPLVVEQVTGIATLGEDQRKVTFTWVWKWDSLTESMQKCLGEPPPALPGTALFRLYDDGWRVEHVSS